MLKNRPAGSAGEIDQSEATPPVEIGVAFVIVVPLVKMYELGEYVIEGGASFTIIVMVVVTLPPVLFPVTVYVLYGVIADGVPLISPVVVSSNNPCGSAGEIDQDTTAPPLEVGVTDVIAESLDKVNELGV
jgi:hypothetical protein